MHEQSIRIGQIRLLTAVRCPGAKSRTNGTHSLPTHQTNAAASEFIAVAPGYLPEQISSILETHIFQISEISFSSTTVLSLEWL